MEHCSKEKWEEEEDKIEEDMSKYSIADTSTIWINSVCPECETVNWIEMVLEPEACECCKCKKSFWISEKIYEDYKTSLVMAKVFNSINYRPKEVIFDGMEKPIN